MKKSKTNTKKPKTKLWLVREYLEPTEDFNFARYYLLRSEKPPVLKKSDCKWVPIGTNKAYMCRNGLEDLTKLKLLPGYYQEVEVVVVPTYPRSAQSLYACKTAPDYVNIGVIVEAEEDNSLDIYFRPYISYSLRVWKCLSKMDIPPTGLSFRIQPKGGY